MPNMYAVGYKKEVDEHNSEFRCYGSYRSQIFLMMALAMWHIYKNLVNQYFEVDVKQKMVHKGEPWLYLQM